MSITEKLTVIAENEKKVYDAGAKSEYDKFWDSYFNSRNKFNYFYMFAGYGWTKTTMKPKYDLKPVNARGMFQYNYCGGDLAQILGGCGVILDTSNMTDCTSMFHETAFTRLPTISLVKATATANAIYNCFDLVTIDEVIVSETTTFNSSTFGVLAKLQNLTISGTIAKNNFNVSSSTKLTHDSLMTIINALKDYSDYTGTTNWVCTLGITNLGKLTDEEKAIATEKGWTLA